MRIDLLQLMEDLIGDLTAMPQPIEVKLFGDDPTVLTNAARSVGEAISRIPGVIEVVDGLRVAVDANRESTADRANCAGSGLPASDSTFPR